MTREQEARAWMYFGDLLEKWARDLKTEHPGALPVAVALLGVASLAEKTALAILNDQLPSREVRRG